MLALALEATAAFGVNDVEIRTGDVALFNALIDALGLYRSGGGGWSRTFKPQDQPGRGYRAADARDRARAKRI